MENFQLIQIFTTFKLKPWFSCFAWIGEGIVGINTQGYLVFIDLAKTTDSILWELPISPFSSISFSADTKSGVIVSGDRLPEQRILLLQTINGIPVCTEWIFNNSVVKESCMDQNGMFMLLSTQSRELWLFKISTKEPVKVSYRLASGLPSGGTIIKCSLITFNNNSVAALATNECELPIWDSSQESIIRKGNYKGLRQQTTLEAIEIIPEEDKLVLATNDFIEVTSIYGDEKLVSKSPVTQCCLSNDGWFITVNEQAKKVTWFKNDKFIADFFPQPHQPFSIASFGSHGTVVVGYKNGFVVILRPNQPGKIKDLTYLMVSLLYQLLIWVLIAFWQPVKKGNLKL